MKKVIWNLLFQIISQRNNAISVIIF